MLNSVTIKLTARLRMQIARAARRKRQLPRRWIREAIEREAERAARFVAYVKQAQHVDPDAGAVEESEARNRLRFWLEQLSAGKGIARTQSRRAR